MKALFKINADESTFTRTIDVAAEIEDAAKVAKETVFGSIPERVQKAKGFLQTQKKVLSTEKHKGKCYRCEKAGHLAPDCYFKNATCNYCKLQGHLESVCPKKKSKASIKTAKFIFVCNATDASDNFCRVPKLQIPVYINSQEVRMELDTATGRNCFSQEVWKKLGKSDL